MGVVTAKVGMASNFLCAFIILEPPFRESWICPLSEFGRFLVCAVIDPFLIAS